MQTDENRFSPLLAVLLLGFTLRLIWALLIPVDPISDSFAYHTFASNIADHGVYGWTPDKPSAYWAVGPAAIYAAGYMLFGTGSGLSVVLVNMISSLVAIWCVHDLGKRWFSARVGLLAALILAIWPVTIQFTTVLASELHFIALTLAALSAWERAGFGGWGMFHLVLAGLLLGAATYVRPIALLIPVALVLAGILRTFRLSWLDLFKAAVTTTLIFALVSPWSARNERVFDESVFISTNFWANFWMGNHPDTTGGYAPLPKETDNMSEIERSDYLKGLSLEALNDAPGAFVGRTIWKAVRLHERENIGVTWNQNAIAEKAGKTGVLAMKMISTGFWYFMLITALTGTVILARQGMGWRVFMAPPVWLWLYFTGVHAVIVVGDRYHMPAIPMIALLSAVTFASWTGRIRPRA